MNKGYTIKRQLRFTELTEGFVNYSSSYLCICSSTFLGPSFHCNFVCNTYVQSEIKQQHYHSFKIFPHFWLVETTRITHHNQLLFTKFGKKLHRIQSMTSKVQPAADYLSDDVKMTSKEQSAANYWTIERKKNQRRDCVIFVIKKMTAISRFRSLSKENTAQLELND